ncbi:isoaspartyl peptidase/L-asparaginase [Sphingomonas sp. I4]
MGRGGHAHPQSGVAGTRRHGGEPHVLLAGAGADRSAVEQGLEQVDPAWFHTDERRRQFDELLSQGADAFDSDMKYGTVGAVACDAQGHVAAATSTGA